MYFGLKVAFSRLLRHLPERFSGCLLVWLALFLFVFFFKSLSSPPI